MTETKYKLTIFTPTYNRAYILPELKASLERQDDFDFEWLIIDDGSTDNTEDLVRDWIAENLPYEIHYYKVPNSGKPRAINMACELAQTPWLFIVDSDDYLADNLVGFLITECEKLSGCDNICGIGGLRGNKSLEPNTRVTFTDVVDASNLERPRYGLDVDCNEVYRVETLRQFPFEVWPGEIFTPEQMVLNEMSLHGYKHRWFNRVFVISEYRSDGMTRGAWALQAKNPMGYAMMFNHSLKYGNSLKADIFAILQFLAMICYAGHPEYVRKCNRPMLALLLFPLGWLLSLRRRKQFQPYK